MLKGMLVSVVCTVCASLCRENGSRALADAVEFSGRVLILVFCVPFIRSVLETALMNSLHKGELSTMIPSLRYEKYPVTIIRPLYYAMEKLIIKHAKERGYYGYTCTCTFQDNSTRKDARAKLSALTENNPVLKQHLFDALMNVNISYLPKKQS